MRENMGVVSRLRVKIQGLPVFKVTTGEGVVDLKSETKLHEPLCTPQSRRRFKNIAYGHSVGMSFLIILKDQCKE